MEIAFPASKSCLWDERPTGETINLHLSSPGWIQLKIDSNVIDMAIVHSSRQSCDSEAWLMATPTVTKDHCITVEVNRFDPGKWIKNSNQVIKLHPTIILPGDIAIHCKVIDRSCTGNSDSTGILTHNTSTLQNAYSLLDQRMKNATLFDYHLLMSIRIIIIKSNNHKMTVKVGCVLPSTLARVCSINNIPLYSTPLSRNLTGHNMLSLLQSNIRMGYLSMDKCRKLVPLLHSDNSVHSLPLVGIWLSGVNIDHPMIWSMCLQYDCDDSIDKVYGRDHSFLVLLPGRHCQLWQCSLINEGWEWLTGDTTIQLSSLTASVELMPCIVGGTATTLLQSSLSQWSHCKTLSNDCLPLHIPAPQPLSVPSIVSHDTDLSCISEYDVPHKEQTAKDSSTKDSSISNSSSSSEMLRVHQKQLEALQEQVRLLLNERSNTSKEVEVQTTPTNNASTNTGRSLLEGIPLNFDSSLPSQVSKTSQYSASCDSSGTLTPPMSPPTISSIMSTSILSRNLLSPEYSYSTEERDETEGVEETELQQQLLYKKLKDQINELLGTSCDDNHNPMEDISNTVTESPVNNEGAMSFLDVPRIKFSQNDMSQLSEVTLDTHSNLADIITQQYTMPSNSSKENSSNIEYSVATQNYLTKHGLVEPRPPTAKILDIQRLRNVPKLI